VLGVFKPEINVISILKTEVIPKGRGRGRGCWFCYMKKFVGGVSLAPRKPYFISDQKLLSFATPSKAKD